MGRALFIGTPQGYNHFYDLYNAAQELPDWQAFHLHDRRGGNVPKQEIEAATHELDERTYRQEFQARFENLTAGLVYYGFDRDASREIGHLQSRAATAVVARLQRRPGLLGVREEGRRIPPYPR